MPETLTTNAGWTMYTCTPVPFSSQAIAFVHVCSPPFVQLYAASRGAGIRPSREPTLRMSDFGAPRFDDRATSDGRTVRVSWSVPRMFCEASAFEAVMASLADRLDDRPDLRLRRLDERNTNFVRDRCVVHCANQRMTLMKANPTDRERRDRNLGRAFEPLPDRYHGSWGLKGQ